MSSLLLRLQEEKQSELKRWYLSSSHIDSTYNSNHIAGNRLIQEQIRLYYDRGIQNWGNINAYWHKTCLTAQDTYKAFFRLLRYPLLNNATEYKKHFFGISLAFSKKMLYLCALFCVYSRCLELDKKVQNKCLTL